jgi:hypothetical protein
VPKEAAASLPEPGEEAVMEYLNWAAEHWLFSLLAVLVVGGLAIDLVTAVKS